MLDPMLLEAQDSNLYIKLHRSLMNFVNQRLNIAPGTFETVPQATEVPTEIRMKLRDAFLENLELIDLFVNENPDNLTIDELDIIGAWRHAVQGKFCIVRDLKNDTVFLSMSEPIVFYGVIISIESAQQMARCDLPIVIHSDLLCTIAVQRADCARRITEHC